MSTFTNRITRIKLGLLLGGLFLAPVANAFAEDPAENRHCKQVGGAFLTNLSVIDPATTLGVATGDLTGAVAATILPPFPKPTDNPVVFEVQHHFVTEAGDTITVAVAKAVGVPVAPGLVAITDYPIEITGGTGRFNGATGKIKNIGEVDLITGRTIFRYSGTVCFAPAVDTN